MFIEFLGRDGVEVFVRLRMGLVGFLVQDQGDYVFLWLGIIQYFSFLGYGEFIFLF